jgi:hypothetical protein
MDFTPEQARFEPSVLRRKKGCKTLSIMRASFCHGARARGRFAAADIRSPAIRKNCSTRRRSPYGRQRQLRLPTGTDGSNPASSSGESTNHRFRHVRPERQGRGTATNASARPRSAAIAWLRIERLDQRTQRRPGHNPLHLGKKRCTLRRLGVAFKPHCRQRQLLHPPTLRTNPPIRHYTTITAAGFAEVP